MGPSVAFPYLTIRFLLTPYAPAKVVVQAVVEQMGCVSAMRRDFEARCEPRAVLHTYICIYIDVYIYMHIYILSQTFL